MQSVDVGHILEFESRHSSRRIYDIDVWLPHVQSWIPSPLFPIYIHKDKHGSDSEVHDMEGRY
jgi:hypothetical protein